MSIEQVSEKTQTPLGHVETPKSDGKKWLVGGCGCLVFLLVICGGGGLYMWFQLGKPFYDFLNENMTFVQSAEEMQQALGLPIETGAPETTSTTENGVPSKSARSTRL